MRVYAVLIGLVYALKVAAFSPIWLQNYESGVPATINPEQYASLNDLFLDAFSKYEDLPAFANMGKTLSFAEVDAQSKAFAAYLQNKFKIVKGDRFAIMLPNVLQYPIAMIGVLRAGGVVVNVNPMFTATELRQQLQATQATGIIVLENFAHKLSEIIDNTQIKHIIVSKLGDEFNFPKGLMVDFNIKYIRKMIPSWKLKNYTWFKEVLLQGRLENYKQPQVVGHDIAFLQYTGGTTGIAKSAILTHRNMIANVLQSSAWLSILLEPKSEIVITALPLYHVFALTANCLTFMYLGGLDVLITNPRDIKSFVQELKHYKFTVITGVNTLFNLLITEPGFKELDFSRLKFAGSGGMPLQQAVVDNWQAITNKPLLESYGLTETAPAACMNPMNLSKYMPNKLLPISSTEISIRDEFDRELIIGETGELLIRGPQVMAGYWRQDLETQRVLTKDGWLRTGDIAMLDAQGFVHLVDRKKNVINISGFKVYPNEVETVIAAIPGISEVAVVADKNLAQNEIVKAYVVSRDSRVDERAVLKFCAQHLAAYKVPKQVIFLDNLPKSNLGKILRNELP